MTKDKKKSLYVNGRASNRQVKLLVDSGAVVSVVKKSCADELGLPLVDKRDEKLIGASGINLVVHGRTSKIPVNLSGLVLPISFLVVENIVTPFILGTDFLREHGVKLDFENLKMNVRGRCIPLKYTSPYAKRALVVTTADSQIKGQSMIQCVIQTVGTQQQSSNITKDGVYLYNPNCFFWGESYDTDIQGALVNVLQQNLTVPVEITDPQIELFLPEGTVVGTISTIDPLLASIERQLSTEEKTNKVIKELKIDSNNYIDEPTKRALKDLVEEFLDVFSENKYDLGNTDMMEAEINLSNGDSPIIEPYRRPPVHLLPMVAKEIEDLLEAGVIRESLSPFNTATVIIKKPDGSVRLCIDYRSLNKQTISVTAPLPPLDMIISQVGGRKYYSKMDLTKGYYAIKIKEDHVYKTAWSIPGLGAYEFVRLPLGLKNSPSYFCQLLTRLFRGLDHQKCFIYLDDILTSSHTVDEMLEQLRLIFQRLRIGKLKLSPEKCEFLSRRIMFLGSWISEKGYEADQEKVRAIVAIPFPQTKKKLQSFLGAANWFRGLIPNYATLCGPLTDLLKQQNNKIASNPEALKSFDKVKEALSSMSVMILPDLQKTFVIYCDASFVGLGAAIGHEELTDDGKIQFRPIAYASRVLTGPEKKWPSFKLEMKCVHYALTKWEHFIYGSPNEAIVYTDMLALTAPKFLNKTNCRLLLAWSMKLSEFNFQLKHVKGENNELADTLSRAPTGSKDIWDYWVSVIQTQEKPVSTINLIKEAVLIAPMLDENGLESQVIEKTKRLGTFEDPLPITLTKFGQILSEQLLDPVLRIVREWLTKGQRPPSSQATGFDQVLRSYFNKYKRLAISPENLVTIKYWGEASQKFRLLVCVPESLMVTMMKTQHDLNGHPGVEKTMQMLRQTVWWPSQTEQVKLHIQSCEACFFFNEGFKPKPRVALRLYDQRNICNSRVYCDTMGPIYNKTGAERHILLVTCGFSKFVTGVVLPNIQSQTIAKGFLECHIFVHGCPEQLVTDQGTSISSSQVIKNLYNLLNIDKIQTTAYHPQTNLTENRNKTVKQIISKLVQECPEKWPKYLQMALFSYNNTVNKSTGYSPGYLFYGRHMRNAHDICFGTTTTKFFRNQAHYANELYWQMREVNCIVRNTLQAQQERCKRYYDRKVNSTNYKKGDFVAVSMPLPHAEKADQKFKTRLRVLFQISQVISDHNYLLKELTTGKEKVVHHDRMRYITPALAAKIAERLKIPQEETAPQKHETEEENKHEEEEEDDIELHGMKFQWGREWTSEEQDTEQEDEGSGDDIREIPRRSGRTRQAPRWLEDYDQ